MLIKIKLYLFKCQILIKISENFHGVMSVGLIPTLTISDACMEQGYKRYPSMQDSHARTGMGQRGPEVVHIAITMLSTRHIVCLKNRLPSKLKKVVEFHKNRYKEADILLAYFQAYSNTYAPLEKLKELYE